MTQSSVGRPEIKGLASLGLVTTPSRSLLLWQRQLLLLLIGAFAASAPSGARAQCVGDCNRDGMVLVNEVVIGVNIALGRESPATCPLLDRDNKGTVTVDELTAAVRSLLNGCPPTDTPTATSTPTVMASATATPIQVPTPTTLTQPPTHTRTPAGTFTPVPPTTVVPTAAFRCGDGTVNQANEQCDGTADAACPGRCAPDCTCCALPEVIAIEPTTGTVGTPLTITGRNLDCGGAANVHLSCGAKPMAITSFSATTIGSVIPPGAVDCVVTVTTPGGSASSPPVDVELTRDFSLAIVPAAAAVIQGSQVSFTVTVIGTPALSDLVTLQVAGLPAGVTASLSSPTLTAGQSAKLTLAASGTAVTSDVTFSVDGTAYIDGAPRSRSGSASLSVEQAGQTGIVGQFVLLHGPPLQGVKLTLNIPACIDTPETCPITHTDAGGNFRFVGVPPGTHTMSVDATPVDPRLPIYGVDVTLVAAQITQLAPLKIYPPLPEDRFDPIANTQQDQQITDPENPDAAFTLPAGVTITGWDNKPKEKMTILRLNPDELPVPPPPGPTNSLYQPFFGTPMGGIPSAPIPVTLPNDLGLEPGDQAQLWYYDAAPFPGVPGEWRMAGNGTVTEDGSKIVSDPGVGIERFCGVCGLSCFIPNQDGTPNHNPDGTNGGDPVDLKIGQMIVQKTDLVLPGRVPAIVHRTYNPFDPFRVTRFQLGLGPGWTFSVDVVLQAETPSLLRIILPGNSRFAFARQADGTFANGTHPRFAGTVLTQQGGGNYELRFKEGAIWRFVTSPALAGVGLLAEQVDRNGNRLVIDRDLSISGVGQINRIIEPAGRELVFSHSGGRPTQITDPVGRTVKYAYDNNGRLATVTDPGEGVTRYTYDSQGHILTITDARGITFLRNEYSPLSGRLLRQIQADGGMWQFKYVGFPRIQCPPNAICDPRSLSMKMRQSVIEFSVAPAAVNCSL